MLDRAHALKNKFRNRQKTFGMWTSLGHPSITEAFCRSKADFVGIDIEHSTISLEQTQRIIAACQAAGVCCLPRLASHNMEDIKRVLDSGADGVIIPMVNTPAQAKQLVQWMKYAPMGQRSFGVARAQGYGFDFDAYTRDWNRSSSLIIQIESIEGVDNIDALLSIDEVDGAMIGPYDLSGTLGVPGELEHPKVLAACKKVVEACKKHGKACGNQIVEPSQSAIAEKFDAGFTFEILASDVFLLWKWTEQMARLIEQNRSAR